MAEQSQQAAKEIAALISQIKEDTGKAVQAMEGNTQVVESGSRVQVDCGCLLSEQLLAALVTDPAGLLK